MFALVGCDHATKAAAKRALSSSGPSSRSLTLVRHVLELRYVENRDTAFSLTRALDSPWKHGALVGVAAAATLALGWMAWRRRRRASLLEQWALVVIMAGAVGNGVDRLLRGYVVDFIHVEHWPVFNVADILVVVGALALAWVSLRRTAPPRPARPA